MIDLFQSMQWSKLCWDLSFEEKIKLSDIVPIVGEKYPITLTWNEDYAVSGQANFLWVPPHSELNGWNERPSEIEKSFVIKGYLNRIDPIKHKYELTVAGSQSLLEVAREQEVSDRFKLPTCGLPDSSSYILWDRARITGIAKFGDYIYLSGSDYETSLEAIIEFVNSDCYLIYHACLPPGYYETVVTRKRLVGEELAVLKKVLKAGHVLHDQTDINLGLSEIQGAKYW